MRLIKGIGKQGEVVLAIENLDDLWYLHEIIEPGDSIAGKTSRKIKVSEEQEGTRRVVTLGIRVAQVDFAESTSTLRVLGTVISGPEDVPRGDHHTFVLEPGVRFTLTKQEWLGFQRERLKEACADRRQKVLVCVFDREEARFARIKQSGFVMLAHLRGEVARKRLEGKGAGRDFFMQILEQLEEYDKRFGLERIIIGSSSFWRGEMQKRITNAALKKKVLFVTCSGTDASALNEVLRRDEVRIALARDRITREINLVDELLVAIRKASKVTYGLKQVLKAADAGAIATLIVSDKLIRSRRAAGTFAAIEALLRAVDRARGKVVIVSSEHEGGKKIDGLGGVAALLRYDLE